MDSRKNEKKPAEAGFLLCVRATGRRTTNTKAFRKRSLMDTGSLDGVPSKPARPRAYLTDERRKKP
jgi:hypothetical protein